MLNKIAGATLAAALLVGAAATEARQAPTKIVLGVPGRPDQASLELALQRGRSKP
ncbi:MAG TPA: hypothetical protein VN823_24080 [Stellaceae bacterium]|nr:hypothetical protein [Stellaceae bacterium]